MRKKNLIVAGAIIVVLLGFAGCSNNSINTNTSTETKKVTANTDKQIEAPKASKSTTPKVTNEKKESTNYGGINPNVVEHKAIMGSNDSPAGNYAITTYDAATTTDEDIIRFYNDKIKGSKNNYFILSDGDNSIEFCGSNGDNMIITDSMIKGPISDAARNMGDAVYYGKIDGNKIKWVKSEI